MWSAAYGKNTAFCYGDKHQLWCSPFSSFQKEECLNLFLIRFCRGTPNDDCLIKQHVYKIKSLVKCIITNSSEAKYLVGDTVFDVKVSYNRFTYIFFTYIFFPYVRLKDTLFSKLNFAFGIHFHVIWSTDCFPLKR